MPRELPVPAPTPEQTRTIVTWLKRGAIPYTACCRAQVPEKIFQKWLRLGADGKEPFKTFVAQVDLAIVDFECDLLTLISENANKAAHTAQWLFMLRFGPKYKKAAEEALGPIEAEKNLPKLRDYTEDEVSEAEARMLAEAAQEPEPPKKKKMDFGLGEYGGHKARH